MKNIERGIYIWIWLLSLDALFFHFILLPKILFSMVTRNCLQFC